MAQTKSMEGSESINYSEDHYEDSFEQSQSDINKSIAESVAAAEDSDDPLAGLQRAPTNLGRRSDSDESIEIEDNIGGSGGVDQSVSFAADSEIADEAEPNEISIADDGNLDEASFSIADSGSVKDEVLSVQEDSDDPFAGLQRAVLPSRDDSDSVADEISIEGDEDYANDSFSVGEDVQIDDAMEIGEQSFSIEDGVGDDDEIEIEEGSIAEDMSVGEGGAARRPQSVASLVADGVSSEEDYAEESFAVTEGEKSSLKSRSASQIGAKLA